MELFFFVSSVNFLPIFKAQMRRKERKMRIWEKLFGSKNNETTDLRMKEEAYEPSETESTPEPEEIPREHNYGLDMLSLFLASQDYGWTDPDETHKKVILTNPADCKDKITLFGLVSAWRETGHSEWEALLAGWFIDAVLKAITNGESEADITHLFNRDFLARNGRTFTAQQVYDHIIKWFDIVEETDDVLKLKIHI